MEMKWSQHLSSRSISFHWVILHFVSKFTEWFCSMWFRDKEIRAVRKADTNIVSINLGSLSDAADVVATGDPTFCSQCGAVLNSFSKLKDLRQVPSESTSNNNTNQQESTVEGNLIWECEFCGQKNRINLDPEEVCLQNPLSSLHFSLVSLFFFLQFKIEWTFSIRQFSLSRFQRRTQSIIS
jgi:hypothetical protein